MWQQSCGGLLHSKITGNRRVSDVPYNKEYYHKEYSDIGGEPITVEWSMDPCRTFRIGRERDQEWNYQRFSGQSCPKHSKMIKYDIFSQIFHFKIDESDFVVSFSERSSCEISRFFYFNYESLKLIRKRKNK